MSHISVMLNQDQFFPLPLSVSKGHLLPDLGLKLTWFSGLTYRSRTALNHPWWQWLLPEWGQALKKLIGDTHSGAPHIYSSVGNGKGPPIQRLQFRDRKKKTNLSTFVGLQGSHTCNRAISDLYLSSPAFTVGFLTSLACPNPHLWEAVYKQSIYPLRIAF